MLLKLDIRPLEAETTTSMPVGDLCAASETGGHLCCSELAVLLEDRNAISVDILLQADIQDIERGLW